MITTYLGIYLLGLGISFLIAYMVSRYCSKTCLSIVTRILRYGAVVYGICIIWTSVVSYLNFSEYIDLSYYHSFLKQLRSGTIPLVWDTGVPVWAQHISPFLFLLLPLYVVGSSASLLVLFQAIGGVAAAIPLYVFTKHVTKSSFIAICIAWGYLLSGAIQSSIYYGFHEVTFFPLMFFSVLLAWSKRKYRWFMILFILMLFIKEEIAFYGCMVGIYFLLRRDRKYGIFAIIASCCWYGISFGILSLFRHGGYEYWGQFIGGTAEHGIGGIVWYILSHPIATFIYIFQEERKILMLIESFGSIGFIPLMYPPSVLLILPALSMKLLSSDITMMNSFHYSATYIGVLFGAVVLTVSRRVKESQYVFIGIVVLSMSCIGSFMYGYGYYYKTFPKMTLGAIRLSNFIVNPRFILQTSMIERIPQGESVGCQYQLCSHIERPYGKLYPIPGPIVPTYVIVDMTLPFPLKEPKEIQKFFTETLPTTHCIIDAKDGIFLLKQCNT